MYICPSSIPACRHVTTVCAAGVHRYCPQLHPGRIQVNQTRRRVRRESVPQGSHAVHRRLPTSYCCGALYISSRASATLAADSCVAAPATAHPPAPAWEKAGALFPTCLGGVPGNAVRGIGSRPVSSSQPLPSACLLRSPGRMFAVQQQQHVAAGVANATSM